MSPRPPLRMLAVVAVVALLSASPSLGPSAEGSLATAVVQGVDKPGSTEFTGPGTPAIGSLNDEYAAILESLGANHDALNVNDPTTSGYRMTLQGRELIVGLVQSEDSPATRSAITARVIAANPQWSIVWQVVPFSAAQLVEAKDSIEENTTALEADGADIVGVTIALDGLMVRSSPSMAVKTQEVLKKRYGEIVTGVIGVNASPVSSGNDPSIGSSDSR